MRVVKAETVPPVAGRDYRGKPYCMTQEFLTTSASGYSWKWEAAKSEEAHGISGF